MFKFGMQCLLALTVLLSAGMNAVFFAGLATQGVACALLVTASLSFEGVKGIALALAQQAAAQRRFGFMGVSAAVYGLLAMVSILAATSVLQQQLQAQYTHSVAGNAQYQALALQISEQTQAVSLLRQHAKQDIAAGYRARAQQTLGQVASAQEKLSTLLAQQADLAATVPVTGIGLTGTWTNNLVVAILGSLLELVLGYLIFAVKQSSLLETYVAQQLRDKQQSLQSITVLPEALPKQSEAISSNSATSLEAQGGAAESIAAKPTSATVSQLAQLIETDVLLPTSRAIRNHLGSSTQIACSMLRELAAVGVIEKTGRGYRKRSTLCH